MLQNGTQPELGADITPLTLDVERVSRGTLRLKIGAPGRWEVPRSLFKTDNITAGAPGCCQPAAPTTHQALAALFETES